jgi:hypothetical protein
LKKSIAFQNSYNAFEKIERYENRRNPEEKLVENCYKDLKISKNKNIEKK